MNEYLPYATETQRKYIEAVEEHGGIRAAARALGMHHSTLQQSLKRLKAKAAAKGFSPEEDASGRAPEGYHVKGKSVLYDADGKVRLQWVKTNKDAEKLEDIARLVAEELEVPAAPARPPLKEPCRRDRLGVYPIGDMHVGMHAWHEETGADFDLKIARELLAAAAWDLVGLMPRTKKALIVNVGDFVHADNAEGRTERGGNILDMDSRWAKMIRVAIACLQEVISAVLSNHEEVELINAAGNHDTRTSYMLSLILDAHYRDEPRVTIRTEPTAFHYVEFGKCLFGVTHGDKVKPHDLPGIMAVDEREAWGRTLHRYWLTGHVHHDQRKEYPGCMFESFRTLASSDAWHRAQGYRSGRDMKAIVYDAERGEIQRFIYGLPR